MRDARRGQASESPGQDPDYDHFDQMLEGIAQVGLDPQQGAQQQQQGEPMFGLEKVPYQPKGLKQMVVCNDVVAMALSNGHIIRLRLDAPDDLEDIEFARRKEDQIHSIFLDPTGNSLIISMENKENWYLHASWKKPRPLSKMKGLLIESVAWDTHNTDPSNTGEILIGSRDGRIFETAVEAKDKLFVEGKEKYFKPIYALGEDQPVLGLRYERFPPSRVEGPKFFVMAATGTRLYQFIGGPTFEAVFGGYERNPAFLELPGEQAGRRAESNISFFSKYQGVAKSFAWLTGPGIYHGSLVFGSQNPGDSVMADTQLLPYPWCDEARQRRLGSPLSLVLSEFHFLLLYEDRFVAVSQLDNTVAHEESLGRGSRGSRMRGLVLDPTKAALWAYAEDAIYQLFAVDEDRHVWRKYLEKGLFEEALRYCKLPGQRDQVLLGQAEYYLQAKRYESAARAFAKTTAPFEEVALRFIALGEKDALKAFLTTRLALLPPHALMQRTALAAWIVEQYLARLNQLREARLHDQHAMLLDELRGFLKEQREDLERARPTINQLLWSHGHPDLARYFAAAVGDDARVLRDLVRGGEWANALEVLARANSGELYYQFSPTLMAHVPRPTVDAWISSRTPLQPRKLLPALMRYQPSPAQGSNESIRYLEHCIQKGNNQDPAIHNYLLSLYAQQGSEEALLGFLQREEAVFDLRYALRLALRHEKRRACVDIYSAMGLHEEAVDLAIRLDVNLAKAHANRPQDDEVRKKLWLRIARHVVEEDQDIKKAMAFLKDCELLKIEDILPFFPDFVLIDDFKEEICGSLEEYNRHIEDLKHEMDDATHSADLIRLDIKQLRSKCGFVAGNQKCDLCAYPVLSRQFYLFPCQHTFHADCLAREITRHLTDAQRLRLRELQLLVAEHSRAPAPRPKSSVPAPAGDAPATATAAKADIDLLAPIQTEQLKNELDDLVASQCITCGKLTIDSITRPFIDVRDQDLVKSWFI